MILGPASRLGLGRLCSASLRRLEQPGLPRLYSVAAPATPDIQGDQDDIVLQTFKQQQEAYRQLLAGMKKIPVPLNGDMAAISKYANEIESLKKKVGMPEVDEQVSATLNYKLRVARGNVRKFLTAATEGVDLGAYQDIVPRILGAVEQIEADTGAPLDAANDKGWKALQKRVEAIQKEFGLEDYAKVKKEAVLEMYKAELDKIKEQALEKMDIAKRRDGLDFVSVDLSTLKPKLDT